MDKEFDFGTTTMKPCHFDKVFQMMTACVAIFIHILIFLEPVGSACQKVQ